MDDYLSGIDVAIDLERHFGLATDTALHIRKDFAVAPSVLPRKLTPKGAPSFQTKASLFAPLGLLQTGVTRYDPAFLRKHVFGLSSGF